MVDRAATHARIEKLLPRNHPVLALRQRRDEPIDAARVKLTPYVVVNFTTLAHGVMVAVKTPRRRRDSLQIRGGSQPPMALIVRGGWRKPRSPT